MTNKEILAGLKYRLVQLKKIAKSYEKGQESWELIIENKASIDEVQSIMEWIKNYEND